MATKESKKIGYPIDSFDVYSLLVVMVTIGLVIGFGVLILSQFQTKFFYDCACCEGCNCACTDTYYSDQDGLCHLVLCENGEYMGFKNCTYEPNMTCITTIIVVW